jgi:hypothetical protein
MRTRLEEAFHEAMRSLDVRQRSQVQGSDGTVYDAEFFFALFMNKPVVQIQALAVPTDKDGARLYQLTRYVTRDREERGIAPERAFETFAGALMEILDEIRGVEVLA